MILDGDGFGDGVLVTGVLGVVFKFLLPNGYSRVAFPFVSRGQLSHPWTVGFWSNDTG